MKSVSGEFSITPKKQPGFTLIELMIVVIIIGVIAGISYPSFRDYLIRTKRTDAQTALSRLAGDQEKFRSQCNHYAGIVEGPGRVCGTNPGIVTPYDNGVLYVNGAGMLFSADGHYAITVSAPTAGCPITTCYAMVADPNAAGTTGLQKDNGRLRINSLGVRDWDKKNDLSYTAKWTDK